MLSPVDISYIADELRAHSQELLDAFEDQDDDTDSDPQLLLQALDDLFDGLRRLEDEGPPVASSMDDANQSPFIDVRALGEHGIDLLARLAALADRLLLPQQARAIEELTLPLACWIARHGGELTYLGPVVNGAANLANRLDKPSDLGELHGLLTEIVNAVDPEVSQENPTADTNRPWRILLINRAIVATRSHRPELMDQAFESVAEYLPEEAPSFFREGMEQMDALNYPPQVRAVMLRFHERWCSRRVLH